MSEADFHSFKELMTLQCVDAPSQLYRGINPKSAPGHERTYGGHLLAQALMAAFQTLPDDRLAHSLHAYFLRPGDSRLENEHRVSLTRDGRSFSARQVDIMQQGKIITTLDISFCTEEDGLSHQVDMPWAPEPETLPDYQTAMQRLVAEAKAAKALTLLPESITEPPDHFDRLVDVRPTRWLNRFLGEKGPPETLEWFRLTEELGDNQRLHQCALTYLSDWSLMDIAFNPHDFNWLDEAVQSASLDHAVWFHQRVRADDWLLLVQESPQASGGRGFNRGTVFSRAGALVGSLAQEGLMRIL